MKNEIHPEYFNAEVSCVCGHKYNTGATQKKSKLKFVANATLSILVSKELWILKVGLKE